MLRRRLPLLLALPVALFARTTVNYQGLDFPAQGTHVRWKDTPTQRIKIKVTDGKLAGAWGFPKDKGKGTRWSAPDGSLRLTLPLGWSLNFVPESYSGVFQYTRRPGETSQSILKGTPRSPGQTRQGIQAIAAATRLQMQRQFPAITAERVEYLTTSGGLDAARFSFSGFVLSLGGHVQAEVLVLPLRTHSLSLLVFGPPSTALNRRFREFGEIFRSASSDEPPPPPGPPLPPRQAVPRAPDPGIAHTGPSVLGLDRALIGKWILNNSHRPEGHPQGYSEALTIYPHGRYLWTTEKISSVTPEQVRDTPGSLEYFDKLTKDEGTLRTRGPRVVVRSEVGAKDRLYKYKVAGGQLWLNQDRYLRP